MHGEQRTSVTPQLVFGLLTMAAGALLLLDRFDVINVGRTVRLWPLALIGVGIVIWAQRRDAGGRFWGSVWIILGGWLLLNTLGLVRVGVWELFWPLVLIFVGLKLVMPAARHRRDPGAGAESQFALLAESKRSRDDNPFRSADMTAILGGCRLDLRQAVIPPGGQAVVEVFALLGGVEVWVPNGWSVASDVVPVLGGVEDKRLLPAHDGAAGALHEAPAKLALRGHVVLGGLTIRS